MNLSETTRTVLRLVETRSGIPVNVEPDPSLPDTTLAKVVMARGALALHRGMLADQPVTERIPGWTTT